MQKAGEGEQERRTSEKERPRKMRSPSHARRAQRRRRIGGPRGTAADRGSEWWTRSSERDEESAVERGGGTEWEDWVHGPRFEYRECTGSGGRSSLDFSLPPCCCATRRGGNKGHKGGGKGGKGRVPKRGGRAAYDLGACPESTRMVYRARLITSGGCAMMARSRRFLLRLLIHDR